MGGAALGAVALGYLFNKKATEAEEERVIQKENDNLSLQKDITLENVVIEERAPVLETRRTEVVSPVALVTKAEGSTTVQEVAPVVQEIVHPVELEEVQPIIHRDIRQTEVHQVTQPIYDSYVAPTNELSRELLPQVKETLKEDNRSFKNEYQSGIHKDSLLIDQTKYETILKPALIDEVVKKDIIQIIQPVVHRDTVAPTVIHTSAPVYEKIIEQPVLVRETLAPVVMSHEEVEAKLRSFNKIDIVDTKESGRLPIISEAPIAKIN